MLVLSSTMASADVITVIKPKLLSNWIPGDGYQKKSKFGVDG